MPTTARSPRRSGYVLLALSGAMGVAGCVFILMGTTGYIVAGVTWVFSAPFGIAQARRWIRDT